MEPPELDSYTTAEIYPTGAELFERLQAARLPWADLPESVASSVVHRGHMSWAAAADDYMLEVPSSLQAHHKAALGEVVDRLRHYA
jgi:hypothetical protein